MRHKSLVLKFLVLTLLVLIASCGNDTPSNPTPATQTTTSTSTTVPPSNAIMELTGSYVCTDPFCDGGVYTLALSNRGGVGANVNYLRGKNRSGANVFELGAQQFVVAFGTNRVEAGNTLRFTLRGQIVFSLAIGYTDGNGVTGEITWLSVKA